MEIQSGYVIILTGMNELLQMFWCWTFCIILQLTCHKGGVVVSAGHPADWLSNADLLRRGGVALLPQTDLTLCVVAPHEQLTALYDRQQIQRSLPKQYRYTLEKENSLATSGHFTAHLFPCSVSFCVFKCWHSLLDVKNLHLCVKLL